MDILQNFTRDSTSSCVHHTEQQTQQCLVEENHPVSWASTSSSLAVNRARSCSHFWAHWIAKGPEAKWEEYPCLRGGWSFQDPCYREGQSASGNKGVPEYISRWACCPNSYLPLYPEGQVLCVAKDSRIIWTDAAEKIKSQPVAHGSSLLYKFSCWNTRQMDDISHTWDLSSAVASDVKRSAISISTSHSGRGHCFSGQGWDHSQGHLFTHSSISTNCTSREYMADQCFHGHCFMKRLQQLLNNLY